MDIYTHIFFECGDEASWVTQWPEKWSEHNPYPILEKAINSFPVEIWDLKRDLVDANEWNKAMPDDEEMKVGIIDFVTKLYACCALLMDCFEVELDIHAEAKSQSLDIHVCKNHASERGLFTGEWRKRKYGEY